MRLTSLEILKITLHPLNPSECFSVVVFFFITGIVLICISFMSKAGGT